MSRDISAGIQAELDKTGAETRTVLSLYLTNASELHFSLHGFTFDSKTYTDDLLISEELVQTIDSQTNRVPATVSNVDKAIGATIHAGSLEKAVAVVGRYYPGAGEMLELYRGEARAVETNEREAKIEVVSDLVAAGYCVANMSLAPQCQFKFKDPATCGYSGLKLTCGKTRKGPNGCQEHDAPADDYKFGGSENPYPPVVSAPTGGGIGTGGGGDGPPRCFPAGTLITMANLETRPIEKIRAGDIVLSFNEKTGELVPGRVAQTFSSWTDRLVSIDDGQILAKAGHKFFNGPGKGFSPVGGFRPGDKLRRLYSVKGQKLPELGEWEIERRKWKDYREPIQVFNFEVEVYHAYFANRFAVSNSKNPDDF